MAGEEPSQRVHKSGKMTGYETDNINYWLAPTYIERWGEIADQERALDAIIASTVQAAADMRRLVERQRRKWWDDVYEDLGLDKSILYKLNRMSRQLSPVQPKEQP